jgi:hypothetical protein
MVSYHSQRLKPNAGKNQKIVFDSFADLTREIERQTAKQTYLIDAKVGRARYLIDQKRRLQKKLADVDAELSTMGAGN